MNNDINSILEREYDWYEKTSLINFRYLYSLIRDLNWYSKFLKKRTVELHFTDYDYTFNKYLYVNLANKSKITTISFDHSILMYPFFFRYYFSKRFFTWGEYNRNRILRNSQTKNKHIKIIGKPLNTIYKNNKNLYWIYFLSSYIEPAMQTMYRYLFDTIQKLKEINSFFRNHNQGETKFLIKPHPNDSPQLFKDFPNLLIDVSKETLENSKGLIFEDTSLLFEMLHSDLPLIYMKDNTDHYYFELPLGSDNGVFVVKNTKELFSTLSNHNLNKTFYSEERRNFSNYYMKINSNISAKEFEEILV